MLKLIHQRRANGMKRVLTIQDISCVGKCSTSVALPVISVLGSETVILPTSLLSAHSQFEGFTFKDLTDQIGPITRHWKDMGIKFDAIYTGYLGTEEQIDMVKGIIADFRDDDTLVFVDPVMADFGVLYTGFDKAYADKNLELCSSADIIVPNVTEASIMTGIEYREEQDRDEAYIRALLSGLADLGANINVITGVSLEPGKTGIMGVDSVTGEEYVYQTAVIDTDEELHGTGDLFASICVGEMMRGRSWQEAMKRACDYTARTIEITVADPERRWYGVDFEAMLPELIQDIR